MSAVHALLIGAAAGMRAMTPLAVVANAARHGELPADTGAPDVLAHPIVSAGTLLVAAGELAGDKMRTAPDRIVPVGMVARTITGAIAGAALVPRRQRMLGAALGATAAAGAAYVTFAIRIRAMRRYGQDVTGAVEDAVALGGAALIARHAAVRG